MTKPNTEHPKIILVVEDDFSIRETMKLALESEGYGVLTAENGKIGLEILNRSPKPCLVLLDMLMPIMGGREFLDAVLANTRLAPIPVLIVSATETGSNIHGAKEFLKKPVDLELLLKVVEHYTSTC